MTEKRVTVQHSSEHSQSLLLSNDPNPDENVLRCSLYGTKVCENKQCDGYLRLCDFWSKHSSK